VDPVDPHVAAAAARLESARESALANCRAAIRASGSAVRAVHRLAPDDAQALLAEAAARLQAARAALAPFPAVEHAGFVHDAAKEYVEGVATLALVAGQPVPGPDELGVADPAWLCGLAEAASELRRHALDRLRGGELERAEQLLDAMDDVFGALVTIDAPDAITGGLRRTLDALRAVIERTRGDITNAVLQHRLREALTDRLS
jgi:translin